MSGLHVYKLTRSEQDALQSLHKTWPLSSLPHSARPYAELIRITKPAGVAMFYFPFLYGTFLLSALEGGEPNITTVLGVNAHLLLLSFFLRGTLCTWNDIADQNIDRQVTRTRIRPIARYAVTNRNAYIFLVAQIGLLWACFRTLPAQCLTYASPFLLLHTFYPFAKRLTHHPQLILGFAHSQGIFISFVALGSTLDSRDLVATTSLGLANVFWTLLNDTIYAAQDLVDDRRAGVGSTMVFWGDQAKNFLRALAVLTVAALCINSYILARSSLVGAIAYTLLTCGGALLGLEVMVEKVDLDDPASCGWWFNTGNVWVGATIASGMMVSYLVQAGIWSD